MDEGTETGADVGVGVVVEGILAFEFILALESSSLLELEVVFGSLDAGGEFESGWQGGSGWSTANFLSIIFRMVYNCVCK